MTIAKQMWSVLVASTVLMTATADAGPYGIEYFVHVDGAVFFAGGSVSGEFSACNTTQEAIHFEFYGCLGDWIATELVDWSGQTVGDWRSRHYCIPVLQSVEIDPGECLTEPIGDGWPDGEWRFHVDRVPSGFYTLRVSGFDADPDGSRLWDVVINSEPISLIGIRLSDDRRSQIIARE
jgi:hypothetical protein